MSEKMFTLSFDVYESFSVNELWSDGDAPENPTIEDVKALIDKCGGVKRVLHDWNLIDRFDEFDVSSYEVPDKK